MKKRIISVLLIFFISHTVFSQLVWHVQCTRRPLTLIDFISPTKGLIFGGNSSSGCNISYKSTNNDDFWSLQIYQNLLIGGGSGASFRSLHFVDSLYGWACQDNTTILKTSNGGGQWYSFPVGISFYRINSVYFMNRNTGWIAGQNNNYYNQIAKTINGGINWFLICSSLKHEPAQIYMLNENKGYVLKSFNAQGWDSVASTTDGGYNWNYFRAGDSTGQPITKILFLDSLNGWLLGYNAYVCRTTNGGSNWTFHRNNIWNTNDMYFINNMTGWISERFRIWKTTNGGINWMNQLNTIDRDGYYSSIYFKDQNIGWAVSDVGTVIKSTNGGDNWFSIIEPPYGVINDIYFSSKYTGWAISGNGYVSKTTNGGNNWFNHLQFDNVYLNCVRFINVNTGFVVGSGGKILKSLNGGQTWDSLVIGNYSYYSIDFAGTNTGWICGSGGQILKTTNTGLNWVNQYSGTTFNLNAIQFLNSDIGYIVGDSGRVLKTINGGSNWMISQPLGSHLYSSLFFINSSTGWAVGNKSYGGGMYWGTEKVIINTTNEGISWSTQYSNSILHQSFSFMSVCFINSQTGWVATRYDGILNTTNGGLNWYTDSSPINDSYNTVFFIDNETGWIAGGYNSTGCGGTVLTTGNFPIGIKKSGNISPNNFFLSQNYPNPFNPITRIKFDLPKSSNVKLVIYDILGREIETLVNENKKASTYEIDWDGNNFASGVYFYKLITDEYVETKKMVLLK